MTRLTMQEAHSLRYSIHPGATMMYRDLKQHYWWCLMKRDIVDFVSRCLNCQQVKYEHQKPGGMTHMMPIREWKWERIAMDFVVGLPCTLGKFDAIWVVVDRLTKSTHFVPVQTTNNSEKLAKIYIREIVRLHGVPIPNLNLIYGGLCRKSWALGWILVDPFTLRLMVSLSRLFRFLRTCCGRV